MKIFVTPNDIIKRCLWDNYVYYVLGSEKEAKRLLEENNEILITEEDALVIGLIKVLETDNLIHKFNGYIMELLNNKSIKEKDLLLIKTRTFDTAVDKFLEKFPEYWKPCLSYSKALNDLIEYVDTMKNDVQNIEVHLLSTNGIQSEYYNSGNIKKILKFNF